MSATLYRLPPPKYKGTQKRTTARAEPPFYCVTCDTDLFRIYSSGYVHCGNCGAQITNLRGVKQP